MKIAIGVLLTVFFAVAGQLLLKIGASNINISSGLSIEALLNRYLIFGLLFFILAFICYTALLIFMPLNVAHSMAALQFIGVILGAYFILNEPLPWVRSIGIILIAVGILVVSYEYGQSAD